MTAESDPLIRTEIVALALGVAMNSARRYSRMGTLPPLTAQIPTCSKSAKAWPLSVIRAHDPELGRRCAALAAMVETFPLKAA